MALHGWLILEFKRFVQLKHDPMAWDKLLDECGLSHKKFHPYESYPDDELFCLVKAMGFRVKKGISEIWKDFGIFIAGHFLRISQHRIDHKWAFLDLLERLPEIYDGLIEKHFLIGAIRVSGSEVVLRESSDKFSDFTSGLVEGMADVYKVKIALTERRAEVYCELVVREVGRNLLCGETAHNF